MNAIFTVVNNDVTKGLITVLSSVRYNDVPHYLFCEKLEPKLISSYPNIKFVSIGEVIDAFQYQGFTKSTLDAEQLLFLFIIEYLKAYQTVTYLSEKVHVTDAFDYLEYYNSELFMAPPTSSPFETEYATNQFINEYSLDTRVYLNHNFIVINREQFINQKILSKFIKFCHELYNQAQINAKNLTRIPASYGFNLFAANLSYYYLPQNYLLDIEYTATYNDRMIAFYQSVVFDYSSPIDEQIDLLEIDVFSDTYNFEYLLFEIEFLAENALIAKESLNRNKRIIDELILKRNINCQERLGQ